ncbi:MAG: hypothetical protein PHR79_08200, partial [Bacteroidales bacterium]|nr:hypothetical protein [Bacteroidales bacterium]
KIVFSHELENIRIYLESPFSTHLDCSSVFYARHGKFLFFYWRKRVVDSSSKTLFDFSQDFCHTHDCAQYCNFFFGYQIRRKNLYALAYRLVLFSVFADGGAYNWTPCVYSCWTLWVINAA